MAIRWYPAVVERAEDGSGVVLPDVPGCVGAGDTVAETPAHAVEAHPELPAGTGAPPREPDPPEAPLPDRLSGIEPVTRARAPVRFPRT